MSYTILYRRLALKTPSGKIIFLAQEGDNNEYDYNNRGQMIRTRSWCAISFGKELPIVEPKDIMDWLGKWKKNAKDKAILDFQEQELIPAACQNASKTDWKQHFGWYLGYALYGKTCRNTSYGAFKSFFTKALDNVIPLQEFIEKLGPLRVTYWKKEKGKEWGEEAQYATVQTEEEIIDAFDAIKKLDNFNGGPWLEPHDLWLEPVADTVCAERKTGGTRIKTYINGEPNERYIKKAFPLELTDNAAEAFCFPKKLINKSSAWRTIDVASNHKIRQTTYV